MSNLGSIQSGQPVIGLREKGNLNDGRKLAQQQQAQKFGKIPDMKIEDPEEIHVSEFYGEFDGTKGQTGQTISFQAKGGLFTYSSFHHSFNIVTKAEDGISYSRRMSLEEAKDFMNEVARQFKDNPKLLTPEANRAKVNMLKSFITWGVSYPDITMYHEGQGGVDIEIPNTPLIVGYIESNNQVWVQVYEGKKWVDLEEKDTKEAIKKILDYLPKIVLDSSKGEGYINKSEKFINKIYNRLLKILEYLESIEKQEKEQSQV